MEGFFLPKTLKKLAATLRVSPIFDCPKTTNAQTTRNSSVVIGGHAAQNYGGYHLLFVVPQNLLAGTKKWHVEPPNSPAPPQNQTAELTKNCCAFQA
jgi:hypothetical protein